MIAFFAILLFIGASNYVIDPYGMHFHSRYEGFNKNKPAFLHYTRIVKLFNARAIQPNALFLGNSRILYLIPEEAFSTYKDYSYYNYSLSSGTINEMNDLLEHAIRNYDIEYVCYGIDFIAILGWSARYGSTFDTSLVKGDKSMAIEFLKMQTSTQAIEESYNCVLSNVNDPEGRYVQYHYNERGSRTNKWREINYKILGDKWIDKEMKKVMDTYEPIYNNPRNSIPEYKKEAYIEILEQCKQHQLDYTAFVDPLYKDQFILLMKSTAYPLYIDFLKFLALNGGVWYFGGINEITSNREYYWDTQHPRKVMGELISKVIFSELPPPYTDKLFGTYYDANNIDTLVLELEKLRMELTESH